jgi:hypothetical protein
MSCIVILPGIVILPVGLSNLNMSDKQSAATLACAQLNVNFNKVIIIDRAVAEQFHRMIII